MEISQIKRYLNQPVVYQLPTGIRCEYRFIGCTIVKDEKLGEYRYLAELLDEKCGRSTMQVNLENIHPRTERS